MLRRRLVMLTLLAWAPLPNVSKYIAELNLFDGPLSDVATDTEDRR